MNINNKKIKKGFTLIEILFTISIFLVIFSALSSFTKDIWTYNSFISNNLSNIDTSRNALKTIITEVRTAEQSEVGSYLINQATKSTFSFYSDIDGDGLKEKVKYFLENESIKKSVIKPTGSPLTYNILNEKINIVASNITNTTIFNYYDENYDGTTGPLQEPISVSSIRLLKVTFVIDKDLNKAPGPMTFSSQVSIRNLKDNL